MRRTIEATDDPHGVPDVYLQGLDGQTGGSRSDHHASKGRPA
jgi:hypothetical protein